MEAYGSHSTFGDSRDHQLNCFLRILRSGPEIGYYELYGGWLLRFIRG